MQTILVRANARLEIRTSDLYHCGIDSRKIIREFVHKNPEFYKKRSMGLWTGSTPEKLTLVTEERGVMSFPRGAWKPLRRFLLENDVRPVAKDQTRTGTLRGHSGLNFEAPFQLGTDQLLAIEAMVSGRQGLLLAPCGCLDGNTRVHDPVDGTDYTVANRWNRGKPFHVWAMGETGPVVTAAQPPQKYKEHHMVEITTEAGTVRVTPEHRFLGLEGWTSAREICERFHAYSEHQRRSFDVLLPSIPDAYLSAHARDALRWKETFEGFLGDCLIDHRSDDERPLEVPVTYLKYTQMRTVKVLAVRKIDSRPYFDFNVPIFHNYWAEGLWHHNSGKTVCAVAAAADIGEKTLILVHTDRIFKQWVDTVERFLGFTPGRFNGQRKDDRGPLVIGMLQSVSRRLKRDTAWGQQFGAVFLDECFPRGTMVGKLPIEELREGDVVKSFDENTCEFIDKRVVRRFINRPSALVRVTFSAGLSIICTPGHPFWTHRGWVSVIELNCWDMVLNYTYQQGDSNEHLRMRQTATWVRVDGVTLLEPGSDGRFGGLCPDGLVYNIEVEDTHTYIANGFVVHNCHHAPAKTFADVIGQLPAKWRIGLTATPKRRDGMQFFLHDLFGHATAGGPEVLHEITDADLDRNDRIEPVEVVIVPTDFTFEGKPITDKKGKVIRFEEDLAVPGVYNSMLEAMFDSPDRWKTILNHLRHEIAAGRTCLALASRRDMCHLVKTELGKSGIDCGLMLGSVKDRREADRTMAALDDGSINVGVATTQLADEGLDIPRLDRGFCLTPSAANQGKFTQQFGRFKRKHTDKTDAIYYYFWDRRHPSTRRHARAILAAVKAPHRVSYATGVGKRIPLTHELLRRLEKEATS